MAKDLERFTPDIRGQIAYEHRHRYALCSSFVAGKTVLDAACGEGYGADILSAKARHVVGVDIDPETIRRAAENYKDNKRVEFKVGNCASLPFADGSFDVVVSFETIEHIPEQQEFVNEAARVLKKGGLFIASTPNRPVYSEETGFKNPFHVKELDKGEFRALLASAFKNVQLLGQRFVIPSLIGPIGPHQSDKTSVHSLVARRDAGGRPTSGVANVDHFQYFIAICSNEPLRRKIESPSLFLDEADDLWREHERVLRWASGLHEEDEQLREQLRRSEESLTELKAEHDPGATNVATEDSDESRRLLNEIKEVAASTQSLLRQEIAEAVGQIAREQASQLKEAALARAQADSLRSSLEEAKSAFRRSEERAAQMSRDLAAADAKLAAMRVQEENLANAFADAKQALMRSEKRAADFSHQIADAVTSKEQAERKSDELAVALNEVRADRARAESDVAELRAALASVEQELAAAREESAALQSLYDDANIFGEQQAARAKAAEEKLAAEETQTLQLRDELADAMAKAERLAQDLSKLQEDVEDREKTALDLTQEIEDGEAELKRRSDLLEKYAAAATAHSATLQRLEQQIRVIGIKRAVEAQIASAAKTARIRLGHSPLGLVVYRGRLRSAIARSTDQRPLGRAERRDIEKSNLFDPEWYLSQNPDVAQHRIDPMTHYLRNGFHEDRDPHPLFNSSWYRALYGAELQGAAPLIHYLRNGKSARFSAHPLFDAKFYLSANKDVAEHGFDPLGHYIQYGEKERRDPHPLIWMDRLASQPGLGESDRPLVAYMSQSQYFLASPHPLFDADFYLYENADVRRHGICPLLHYCAIGWREGRQPHRAFAADWYLARNPDVLEGQVNPLEHFVRSGAFEDRSPHPLFDLPFYLRQNRDARTAAYDALSHYVLVGAGQQRETTDKISVADMHSIVPDAYWRRFDPISAFSYFGETRISVPVQAADIGVSAPLAASWPPAPDFNYWLPQGLRDYIIDRYGENEIALYLYLMSAVDRYGDQPEAFAQSPHLATLKERLRAHCRKRQPRRRRIDVSIIIPVYNNLVFTLTSVLSILENKSRYAFEIIIGDDRSSDGTEEVFAAAGGPIAYVRHQQNLGFLGNCNAAAEVAKGRYVVFLNNDTLTLPGWLDELIGVLEQNDRIGLSGSKLLNADGTLQEAGGIFWRDGSAWNFGRNSDPRLPEFNYLKDVDYISGASIALPTKIWKELGGFDTIFTPAYCEDSDLAFRVRDAGLRTVYVPHSELVHHEGKSHGRDTSSGIKAYQIANQEKLLARWRGALELGHFSNAENVFLARDRSRNRPHVLFIDHYIPQWDRDAGSRTMHHFLRMFLEAGFQVTFWPDNLNEDREYCAPLQNLGVEVIYSAAYIDRFEEFMAANGKYFDYALVSRPHIAIKYYGAIRAHARCKILYYGHDIHYKRMELELQTSKNPELIKAIEDMRTQERDNWRKADVVLYPSADESEEVRKALRNCVAADVPMLGYLPDELATAHANLARFESRNFDELLFVGGSHPPNVDALRWFAAEVMPLILAEWPKTRLIVVGSTTSPEVARLESDSIILKGRLSDQELNELYATAGVAVIPLRFGGGVKGKTIEALFNAIPFVATSVGMQGLFPSEPIGFEADDAKDFAKAALAAQNDHETTRANVVRGVAFIEERYSIDALRRAFAPFVSQLTGEAKPVDVEETSVARQQLG